MRKIEKVIQKYKKYFPYNVSIDCASGWSDILEKMFDAIDKENISMTVNQIKEKYGSLRVYVDFPESIEDYTKIEKIIQNAEDKSHHVCEYCGEPSKIKNTNGWFSNKCTKCRMFDKISQ